MKLRDLIRTLEKNGFCLIRQGGHMIYGNGSLSVSVPRHTFLNGKTVHFILKNAGISKKE